ncbi:MAG: hypothetical protein ACLFTI_03550 [Anaerolineales bacterium]
MHAVAESETTPVLSAYVDTGADTTLIPVAYLQGLKAEALYQAYLRGHGGNSYLVTVYLVDLEVAGHLFPGIEVGGDIHDNVPLLGRNVLNKLHLLIAGPKQQTVTLSPALAERTLRQAEHNA